MINRIKKYKVLITIISIVTAIILVVLTIDAIYEIDNWKWFNIDFDKRDHIVSAYGALIGGVLAFLSILFVIYQVLEQREQILQEKINSKIEYEKNLKDRLTLLSSFLKSLIEDIISHGKRMEVFFNKETRFDFLIEKNKQKIFMEVKNVTLFRDKNTAEFPDAITTRGTKHLLTLIDAIKKGLNLLQSENCNYVISATEYHFPIQRAINKTKNGFFIPNNTYRTL